MKAITWLASVTVGVAALSSTSCNKNRESLPNPTPPASSIKAKKGWINDLDQAFDNAKSEKKAILVQFTGSDWCPPCIAMHKNVFSTPEFINTASQNFVLVELDFPKGDKAVAEKNEPLAKKYQIEGFPTVILFNSDGKEFTRFFASEFPTTEEFLKHIDAALVKKNLD